MFRRLVMAVQSRLALALLCLSLGCGADPLTTGQRAAPIVGGTRSGPPDDAVVFLGNCSGVLVAPNLVLTSLECASERSVESYTRPFRCTADGELDNDGSGGGELGPLRAAETIGVFVGADLAAARANGPAAAGVHIVATPSTHFCRNNLAFVVLDRRLEQLPVLPLQLESRVQIGEQVTLIGYGVDPGSAASSVRSRRDVPVLALDAPPRTFQVGPGACAGDAGGPAVSVAGYVVGIHALIVGSPCEASHVRSVYTELAPYARLVEAAFDAAADGGAGRPSDEPQSGSETPAGEEPATGGRSDSELTVAGGCRMAAAARALDSMQAGALLALLLIGRRRRPRALTRRSV